MHRSGDTNYRDQIGASTKADRLANGGVNAQLQYMAGAGGSLVLAVERLFSEHITVGRIPIRNPREVGQQQLSLLQDNDEFR